jgi:hypothetical protein
MILPQLSGGFKRQSQAQVRAIAGLQIKTHSSVCGALHQGNPQTVILRGVAMKNLFLPRETPRFFAPYGGY